MSFVRAVSNGARRTPARPAADTATDRDARGDGEERMSRPPTDENDDAWKARPGSGRASRAEMNERAKDVTVEKRIE